MDGLQGWGKDKEKTTKKYLKYKTEKGSEFKVKYKLKAYYLC